MPASILSCLYAFIACLGFSLVFNLRGWKILTASLGGALGWLVFLLSTPVLNDLLQYFLATLVLSIYAEILARVQKAPVITFQIVAILPLVPGSGIYRTMELAISGNTSAFLETGLHTLAIAGSLSLGIQLVSTLARLGSRVLRRAGAR